MKFDVRNNNCWHEVKRRYKAYWGIDCQVDEQGENPNEVLQIHRGALRLVEYFGVADSPSDGCIVLLSIGNVIHHFGFYCDGLIHTLSEYGQQALTEQQVLKQGIGGHSFSRVVYLNTNKFGD